MPFEDEPTEDLGRDTKARTALAGVPYLTAGSQLRGGRYVLERSLGYGGMAAVWLARDERLDRPVAVKVLSDTLAGDQDYLTRFRREAQVAAGLSHPNLVNVYDFEAADRPYLVMEYVPGGDLGARLARDDPPDPERLAIELLGALSHIHAAGVLHRDVKPQNVLLDVDGRARVTDFGIAQPRDATSLTQTGEVLGTASYLAPEALRGEATGERSDLYSLGVVLAEVTGDRPASASLLALIDRLRAQDAADRPPSAADALRELEKSGRPAAVGEPTERLAAPPPEMPPPIGAGTPFEPGDAPQSKTGLTSQRRRAIGLLALALVAVALAVGLAIGAGGDDPSGDGGRAASLGDQQGKGESGGDGGGESETPPPAEEQPAEPAGSDGAALNDQGFALIQDGRYEEAIPVLQQAVDALSGSGDDLTYGYALYNLGQALRLAGRPEEAIPVLEERLQYPDQTDVVQQELDAARADAGLTDEDSSGPGSGNEPNGNAFGHDKSGKGEEGD